MQAQISLMLIFVTLAWQVPSRAADFVAAVDPVCAMGKKLEQGCDAIRAREIVDASAAQWSAIGRLNYSNTRMRQHCTATLISRDTVLTAAHCLYNEMAKRWLNADQVHFLAGYQRGEYAAHATALSYRVDSGYDVASSDFSFDTRRDWALVKLAEPIGEKVGFIPLWSSWKPAAFNQPSYSVVAGYPGLRPHVLSLARDCQIDWRLARSGMIAHDCPMMGGDSGGPVLVEENGSFRVIAVNSSVSTSKRRLTSYAMLVDGSILESDILK